MQKKTGFAIDLLWIRHNQVGGIESYIRNVMDGFHELDDDFEAYLLTSEDNNDSFAMYENDKRFHLHKCSVFSANVPKRIIWQNLYLGRVIRALNVDICFEPYYCKPVLGTRQIDFYTTIHDLQANHYPEYFSKGKVAWMKFSWWNTIRTSKNIIATSEFVKEDIIKTYKPSIDKIKVVNIPITLDKKNIEDKEVIEKKYGITEREYYFTVSSLLPHKNIGVLLDTIKTIKEEKINLPTQLIVSGVGGKSRSELQNKIRNYNLEKDIQLTEYINDAERNALMKYCRAFLFPSVFEGFGMPPIEAMLLGVPVVTTRKASLEEVTQGKATYVENPYDAREWINKMGKTSGDYCDFDFLRYDKKVLAKKMITILSSGEKNNE